MKSIISMEDIPSEQYCTLQDSYRESLLHHYGQCGHTSAQLIQHAVDGSLKLIDALDLRGILAQTRPAKILEVGSFLGFSTRWILESTTAWGRSVTSVDPRLRHRIFNNLRQHVEEFSGTHAQRLHCLDAYFSSCNEDMFLHDYLNYAPTMTREQAVQLLRTIPTITSPFDTFDFAFIDGDHSYQATVDNVTLAASMMPHGGTIVVHDALNWPEVYPALQSLAKTPRLSLVGVTGQAFHGWCLRNPRIAALKGRGPLADLPGRLAASLANVCKPKLRPSYASWWCDGLGVLRVSA